jgi:hypothetical protein
MLSDAGRVQYVAGIVDQSGLPVDKPDIDV